MSYWVDEHAFGMGFTPEEVEAINLHFIYRLDEEDWNSIEIVEETDDDDFYHLELPSGRKVYFAEELLRKEELAQID